MWVLNDIIMKKFFAIIIAILIIGTAGYFILNRENLSQYSFPEFKNKNIIPDFFRGVEGGSSAGGVLSRVDLLINGENGILEKAANKAELALEKIVDDFKFETFEKIKSAMNEKVDSLGKGAGINIEVGKVEEINPVAFSVKSGTPAYFTIVNRDDNGLDYEADWQDGNKDAGIIKIGEKRTLSHNWTKAGEYLIQFKIISKGEEKDYQFLISIF